LKMMITKRNTGWFYMRLSYCSLRRVLERGCRVYGAGVLGPESRYLSLR
jgi:hypothetical protein